MGRTTALRHEIKRTFIPHLRDKGFACDMRNAPQFFTFRKISSDAVYVCDIQWHKNGSPRFVVNFGKCAAEGGLIPRRHRVSPEDTFPQHAQERGRLSPGSERWSTGGWFRQDRPLLKRFVHSSKFYTPDEVVSKLMTLFIEVEDYWNLGRIGAHVRITPIPGHPVP